MKSASFLLFLLLLAPQTIWSNPTHVPWILNIDQALQQSRKTGKPVFVDAYADWCGWCHQLDKEVYSNARFIKYMERFVPLRVDVEDQAAGTRFAQQYTINDLPTLLVLAPNGETTNRIGGYLDAEALMQDLEKIQRLVEREAKNSADLDAVYDLGNEYLARELNAEAEKRFRKILTSSQATSSQKESATFSLALSQYYQQKYDPALVTLEKYETNFQNGPSDEDALLLLSEINLQLNSPQRAKHYLEQFLRKYPNSNNVSRAQQVLSTIASEN